MQISPLTSISSIIFCSAGSQVTFMRLCACLLSVWHNLTGSLLLIFYSEGLIHNIQLACRVFVTLKKGGSLCLYIKLNGLVDSLYIYYIYINIGAVEGGEMYLLQATEAGKGSPPVLYSHLLVSPCWHTETHNNQQKRRSERNPPQKDTCPCFSDMLREEHLFRTLAIFQFNN